MWRVGCICTILKAFISQIIGDNQPEAQAFLGSYVSFLVAFGTSCKSHLEVSGSPFLLGCLILEDRADRPTRNVGN
jgi:hypothetical protein